MSKRHLRFVETEKTLAVKRLLRSYADSVKEKDNCYKAIDLINERLCNAGVGELSGMPRNPSPSFDRWTDLLDQKIELENELKELSERIRVCRNEICGLFQYISDVEAKMVVRYKYLFGMEWKDVVAEIFVEKADFMEKEESYTRRVFRLHEKAIYEMSRHYNERQ